MLVIGRGIAIGFFGNSSYYLFVSEGILNHSVLDTVIADSIRNLKKILNQVQDDSLRLQDDYFFPAY